MKVLNVGCGYCTLDQNPYAGETFENWEEIRLDINSDAKPDIVNDVTDMKDVQNSSFDAIYSQHLLEHLFTEDVDVALNEFYRVLKKGGFVALFLPDFDKVVQEILKDGDLERVLYVSTGGVIRVIDVIFGYEKAIHAGNHYMMHKTAFNEKTIRNKLDKAGFCNIKIIKDLYDMWITAYKIGN